MRIRRLTMATFFVVAAIISQAQQAELLNELPQTKEQFIASEKNVLATIQWLEATPAKKPKKKNARNSMPGCWHGSLIRQQSPLK